MLAWCLLSGWLEGELLVYLPRAWSAFLIRVVDTLQDRGVWRAYRRMLESQWWGPGRIAALQEEKLAAVVRHAAANSPLLAERLHDAGLSSSFTGSRADLCRLPILERQDLRLHGNRLAAQGLEPGEALANSTGGSTGANVSFLVDRACWRERDAVDLRLWSFLGLGPGARVATVWGSPMDLGTARGLKERVRRWVDNRRLFSAYRVGPADLDVILDWLGRHRPDVLMGYSSVLDQLARRAAARGAFEGPRFIISSAEALFPDQRQRMEKALGAEVFNVYGCREVGLIALECGEHRGFHVMDERLLVERVAGGDGASDVLVTDLDNRATPFLRYRIGDLATAGEAGACPCGRGLSRLGEVVGRSFDLVRGPSGRAVGGTFWSLLLRTGVSGIETFQVVQHALDRIEIRVTPPGALGDAGRETVKSKVREALGEEVLLTFTEADRLDSLPSGKHRFVVSALEEPK